jgi:anthranilate phosphoribosyltransferase
MITMKQAIDKVVRGVDLTRAEAEEVMSIMLSGEATQAQLGSFLTALRIKGETIDEIVGCASVMQAKADHVAPKVAGNYIDLVGTGGDGTNTFNISTTSAIVSAAAGVPVAKHGNRAISSRSGAADVLEALGVNIMLEAPKVQACIENVGIGFMFAQIFNKSMKYVGQARGDMGIRTIFNILGPVSNPSNAKAVLIGVYASSLTEPIAYAMQAMGVERAMIVSGCDGMDEITTTGTTTVSEIKDGKVTTYTLDPKDYGIEYVSADELKGGQGAENAVITKDILAGKQGAKRNIVLLNAGAAIYVGGKAETIAEGIEIAKSTIDSGAAAKKLAELAEFTNK